MIQGRHGFNARGIRTERPDQLDAYKLWLECRNFTQVAADTSHSKETIRKWAREWSWEERAAEVDRLAGLNVAARDTERAKRTLEEHERCLKFLLDKGMSYLEAHEFDSSRDALAACKIAIELRSKMLFIPDVVVTILQKHPDVLERALEVARMSNEELVEETRSLTQEILAAREQAALERAGVALNTLEGELCHYEDEDDDEG